MLVQTLDGLNYKWNVPEKSKKKSRRNVSKNHSRAREIIKEIYPNCALCEEVPIEIQKGKKLYFDFYIPTLNLAIEVHGQQHYSFNSYHFENKVAWLLAKANDKKKKEWCELNKIALVELKYSDSDEEWKSQIKI